MSIVCDVLLSMSLILSEIVVILEIFAVICFGMVQGRLGGFSMLAVVGGVRFFFVVFALCVLVCICAVEFILICRLACCG